jgi:hypothetical protein
MTIYGGNALDDGVHFIIDNDVWILTHANGR